MDFYVGRPCENFRRIQWDTILECKKRGHWRPFEIQLCGGAAYLRSTAAPVPVIVRGRWSTDRVREDGASAVDNRMQNLVLCGILTFFACAACVVYDETVGFNMLMCVFCVLAIVSLWTKEEEQEEKPKPEKEETKEN